MRALRARTLPICPKCGDVLMSSSGDATPAGECAAGCGAVIGRSATYSGSLIQLGELYKRAAQNVVYVQSTAEIHDGGHEARVGVPIEIHNRESVPDYNNRPGHIIDLIIGKPPLDSAPAEVHRDYEKARIIVGRRRQGWLFEGPISWD